ncbi:hypothetical protein D3C71_1087890 [compost metagenome]
MAVVSCTLLTLLLVFGSDVALPAVAVLVQTPAEGSRTRMVTVWLLLNGILPNVQSTTPAAWLQVPAVVATSTNVEPTGSVSVSVTPVAPLGPLLSMRSVYVKMPPAGPGSGESAWLTTRSADCAMAAPANRPPASKSQRKRRTALCAGLVAGCAGPLDVRARQKAHAPSQDRVNR